MYDVVRLRQSCRVFWTLLSNSSEIGDTEVLHEARVQYGIARGHQMLGSFSTCVADSSNCGLVAVVSWKDAGVDPEAKTEDVQMGDMESPEEVDQIDVASTMDEAGGQKHSDQPDANDPTQVT